MIELDTIQASVQEALTAQGLTALGTHPHKTAQGEGCAVYAEDALIEARGAEKVYRKVRVTVAAAEGMAALPKIAAALLPAVAVEDRVLTVQGFSAKEDKGACRCAFTLGFFDEHAAAPSGGSMMGVLTFERK